MDKEETVETQEIYLKRLILNKGYRFYTRIEMDCDKKCLRLIIPFKPEDDVFYTIYKDHMWDTKTFPSSIPRNIVLMLNSEEQDLLRLGNELLKSWFVNRKIL